MAELVEAADAPLFVGSEELLEQVTGFHVHRGALAAMERLPCPTSPNSCPSAAASSSSKK